MKLYSYWRSSSSWRVRIAIAFKELECEIVPVHLLRQEQHVAAHHGRNAMEQVPVLELEDNGSPLVLSQSMAILEYLEERWPEPPLLPRDRPARARARQLAELVNAGIQPLQNLSVLERVKELAPATHGKDWAGPFVARGLRALEETARTTAGRFLIGDAPSLADVCLVPQLYSARRFDVDLEPLPKLVAVERACNELVAFQKAHPDLQPDGGSVS
jgi:maleylacetoacetate isomerase